ncbi:hypothetical protein PRZ48_013485 [Zasmidium cellare]|uniref:Uncharacterized protein n=1 Tax=Zasmidium cellare TaxID=395010 RepID=A0ABR0E1N5_ZASCE|nr:hypothetical protein PRZ48_013485 [Zasmidium cellare]
MAPTDQSSGFTNIDDPEPTGHGDGDSRNGASSPQDDEEGQAEDDRDLNSILQSVNRLRGMLEDVNLESQSWKLTGISSGIQDLREELGRCEEANRERKAAQQTRQALRTQRFTAEASTSPDKLTQSTNVVSPHPGPDCPPSIDDEVHSLTDLLAQAKIADWAPAQEYDSSSAVEMPAGI